MQSTLYIDLSENYHTYYYGMGRPKFWKMFLECHDRNNNRADFILDLERSILIANGKCPNSTTLQVGWHGYPDRTITFQSYMGFEYLGYNGNYGRFRRSCAEWFGVDVRQIARLPSPKPVEQAREEARRKEYFYTRKLA